MKYIKQLDGVRAIAVLLVIICHWLPDDHPVYIVGSVFNGVDIFFVLSGFLITAILLQDKLLVERNATNRKAVFRNFFVRRFLRIFPIYYLTILFLYILGAYTGTAIRSNFIYFFTYTSNFYFFNAQSWDGMLSHLWSLSVEEQFYLFWPFIIVALPKKFLLTAILSFIVIGIGEQLYLANVAFGDILTFSCFDALGMGALLAWAVLLRPQFLKKFYTLFVLSAILCLGLQVGRVLGFGVLFYIPSRTLTSVCTVWAITYILLFAKKKRSLFLSFLSLTPLVFVGKISYGLYCFI